jgi:3-deoxy-7-phosphoheptulonate synthase
MNYLTDNTRIIDRVDVPTPADIINENPITDDISRLVYGTRNEISQILHGKDQRVLVVAGPCSIHDTKSALEYAKWLKEAKDRFDKNLLIVMRVYFEKPRTTVGWKGLINDPDIDGSFNISKGIRTARELLINIAELGLPAGTEYLDPISPQYVSDLISWGAKNGTNGDLKVAIDGIQAANHPHVFLSTTKEGEVAVFKTSGNIDSHIILRGGKNPNYDPDSIAETLTALTEAEVNESIMVDASHGNSQKIFKNQISVIASICDQIKNGNQHLNGVMIESHLVEGNQKISDNLVYGQSITDACMNLDDIEDCLKDLDAAVAQSRG